MYGRDGRRSEIVNNGHTHSMMKRNFLYYYTDYDTYQTRHQQKPETSQKLDYTSRQGDKDKEDH